MPHTPGPWFLEGATVYALNERGENRFTAMVQPGFSFQWVGQHFSRTTEEEVLATARLFKAAPQMLAALEAMIEPWKDWSDEELVSLQPSYRPAVRRAVLAARAAIKAAKGG